MHYHKTRHLYPWHTQLQHQNRTSLKLLTIQPIQPIAQMWLSIALELSKVFKRNWLAFTHFWSKFDDIFCAGVKP